RSDRDWSSDVCSSDLVTKALDACAATGVPRLLLGGGVVANRRLRDVATARAAAAGVRLRIPPFDLCTDNGAMIAGLGAALVEAEIGRASWRERGWDTA